MKTRKGFTLIELLVVIAIIALLLSIVVPSLRMAKRKASLAACLTAMKHVSMAWYMYQEDQNGELPSSSPADSFGWVRHPMNAAGTTLSATQTSPVTDEDEIRGIKAGVLYRYLESPDVYRCPMDRRISFFDKTPVFRSFSMPMCLNHSPSSTVVTQLKKFSEIRSPGTRFMLVEEADGRNFNLGTWGFGAPEYSGGPLMWWDPLGVTHGDSSTVGFCDGHAENRKWVDPFTKERPEELARSGATNYGLDAPPIGQVTDIEYMYSGWAYRYPKK